MSSPPANSGKISQATSAPSFTAAKDGLVIVKVGPDGVKYHVHKALLKHHSEYFRNALRGPWKEAEDGVVTLEDVGEPWCTIGLFVHWLYSGRIPDSKQEWANALPASSKAPHPFHDTMFITCVDAYIFGDRFLIDEFRRAANNSIASKCRGAYIWVGRPLEAVELAFASIPASRVILQLFADSYRYFWNIVSGFQGDIFTSEGQDKLPGALLMRVLRSYHDVGKGDPIAEHDLFYSRCYMEHLDDNEKNECRLKHMEYNAVKDCGYFR